MWLLYTGSMAEEHGELIKTYALMMMVMDNG